MPIDPLCSNLIQHHSTLSNTRKTTSETSTSMKSQHAPKVLSVQYGRGAQKLKKSPSLDLGAEYPSLNKLFNYGLSN